MLKIPLGCEPMVDSLAPPSKKREYKVTNRLQEGKCPIYAVVFNAIDSKYFDTFATAGGNRVTVYKCLDDGIIAVLQCYIDEDKDEYFYTVSWACNIDGNPLLVAGGLNGIIHAIDTGSEKIYKVRLPELKIGLLCYFMTGCVVLFPIAFTFFGTWWFIQFVDDFFSPLYEQMGVDIFGLGFVTSLLFIFLVGVFVSSWLGATVFWVGEWEWEWFIKRMPFVKHIYSASKQTSTTIFSGPE